MTRKKPEYWKSSAILWFLKQNSANDPERAIKDKAKELLLQQTIKIPPVNLSRLLQLRKVISVRNAEIKSLSQLIPVPNGYKVVLNKSEHNSSGRYRFSLAHEIGHTYFYDAGIRIPRRPENDPGSKAEERLCDIFAVEVLMPEATFQDDCRNIFNRFDNWCEAIIALRALYNVSTRALVQRILELNILEEAVIIQWRVKTKSSTSTDKRLRVDWSLPLKEGRHFFIWADKPAPENSIFSSALNSDTLLSGKSVINLDSLKGEYLIEAKRFKTRLGTEYPYTVLSVIWL